MVLSLLSDQSYIVDIRELDEPIVNVIDYHFLYGYYEPTLFVLYEPLRTWGGRVAVRQDTCAIAAISLNITQKVFFNENRVTALFASTG